MSISSVRLFELPKPLGLLPLISRGRLEYQP